MTFSQILREFAQPPINKFSTKHFSIYPNTTLDGASLEIGELRVQEHVNCFRANST